MGGSSVTKMTPNATLNRVICARRSGLSGSGASGALPPRGLCCAGVALRVR